MPTIKNISMIKYLIPALILVQTVLAGESSLTMTHQPLSGLGSGSIHIMRVACHDWYSHSGQATAIGLISAPNVPPTNNPKEATEDLNLASACGLRFWASDIGDPKAPLELFLNAEKFGVPRRFDYDRDQVLRACLECLRLTLPEKLRATPVTLTCKDSDKAWMDKIVVEFNTHDRAVPFFKSNP
jgi:hypothetical protein